MDEKVLKLAASKYREHILPPFGDLLDLDGFDAICALTKNFGGSNIYIPTLRTIFKDCIELDIVYKNNNKNLKELAQTYGFSERHIRNVLKR